jgi:hypothetical protein
VPTRREAGTGLEVATIGLVKEWGAARSDGTEAEVGIHEGATDEVRA